jgi:hypothetical protein
MAYYIDLFSPETYQAFIGKHYPLQKSFLKTVLHGQALLEIV